MDKFVKYEHSNEAIQKHFPGGHIDFPTHVVLLIQVLTVKSEDKVKT